MKREEKKDKDPEKREEEMMKWEERRQKFIEEYWIERRKREILKEKPTKVVKNLKKRKIKRVAVRNWRHQKIQQNQSKEKKIGI